MRNGLLLVFLCLGVLFYLGIYFASFDDAARFDPLRPSTILPTLGRGMHVLFARVWDAGQGVKETFGNPQRERVDRHYPNQAFPR